jgi:hypothetical protein
MVQPFPGWDELITCPATATQAGVGQTAGTAEMLDTPAQLGCYPLIVPSTIAPWSFTRGNGVLATGYLDGRVDGVWVPLLSIDFPDAFDVNVSSSIPNTGLLDSLRARALVKSGAGSFAVTCSVVFFMIFKKQRNQVVVP